MLFFLGFFQKYSELLLCMMDCEETRLYTVKVHDHLHCLHTGAFQCKTEEY